MNKKKDILVIGFALFSIFFGAGNLIFPPYIGLTSGSEWLISFLGFIISDVGIIFLSIVAVSKAGSFQGVVGRAGKKFGLSLEILMMLCLGPILVVPRTAATTFEMSISPLLGNINPYLFSVIFFLIVFVLTIKPNKVMDIIGKVLTPLLLISLAVLIIKGIINPIGDLEKVNSGKLFMTGITQGYQTMDAIAAVIFSSIILGSIKAKGYTGKASFKLLIKAAVIAIGGLAIIYGGLIFLGAHTGDLALDLSNSQLLLFVAESILGHAGAILIGVSMALACLTTSIGLLSAGGSFFERVSNGKLPYKFNVLLMTVTSILVASMGLDKIISLSATLLGVIYPVTIVLILLNLFHKRITNPLTHKVTVYVTLIVSILITLGNFIPGVENLVSLLPLYSKGFGWVVPALVGFIIPSIIPTRETATA